MKYLFILIFSQICFPQIMDTVGSKVDGYQRIRELDKKGNIRKVWTMVWNEEVYSKEYSEYDKNNHYLLRIDSTFDYSNRLKKLERHLGESLENERYEYDRNGKIISEDISIFKNSTYLIYQKWFDGGWNYSLLVDGDPPERERLNEDGFLEAKRIYNKKVKKSGLNIINDSYNLGEAIDDKEIIAEFSGNNIQNTRPFTANSSWEVQWDFNGEIFQIYLQSPKEELWEVLANQSGSGSGSSYYPKGGQYYFKVNAMGNWKIKVIEVK